MKKILLALLAFTLTGAVVASPEAQAKPKGPAVQAPWHPTPKLPTRACPEEDSASRNCYWDAAKRGNGKGHSYFVDRLGKVTYLNPKLNDQAARNAFALKKKRAGWESWGTYDGHRLCFALVDDTTLIQCFDGYKTTS